MAEKSKTCVGRAQARISFNPALFVLAFFILAQAISFAAITSAEIVRADTGAIYSLSFDSTSKSYLDGSAINADIKLRVRSSSSGDLTGKYGGLVYMVNNSYYLISRPPSGELGAFGAEQGSYYADTDSTVNIISSYSRYPASVFAVISSDSTLDSSDTFIYIPQANGWLQGTISPGSFLSTYSQTTWNVTVNAVTMAGLPGSVAITSYDDAALAMGVCSETTGVDCSSSKLRTRTATGVQFYTGIDPAAARANPVTKYLVYNGFNTPFTVGTDLSCGTPSFVPSGIVYDGENLNISTSVTNAGVVDVTAPFNVTFYKNVINSTNVLGSTVVSSLTKGSSISTSIVINTSAFGLSNPSDSATTFYVSCDSANVQNETDESDNNASASKIIYKVIYMDVFIDGSATTVFPVAGRPYNVSVHLYDSASGSHLNDIVQFTEFNGLSVFAPIQVRSSGGQNYSLKATNFGQVSADSNGWANVTLIPTGNKSYSLDGALLTTLNGPYSLALNATTSSGTALKSSTLTITNSSASAATGKTAVVSQSAVTATQTYIYELFTYIQSWLS